MKTEILRDLRSLSVKQAMDQYHNDHAFARRAIDLTKLLEIDADAALIEMNDDYELWLGLTTRVRFKGDQRIMEVLKIIN